MAFSGRLDFNPASDKVKGADGKDFVFDTPVGQELPKAGVFALSWVA